MTGEWFITNKPGDKKFRSLPAWLRSVFRSDEGMIYVPAFIGAPEIVVTLCAGHDNIDGIFSEGHPYFPIDWMAKEFPICAETCDKIRQRVAEKYQ